MNPKSIFSKYRFILMLAGISVTLTACHRPPPPTGGAAAAQGNSVPATEVSASAPVPSVPATNSLSESELAHAKYVHETIERLVTLQMNDDPASLAAILVEMKNSEKTIRAAALKAVIQFNDRSAIPALQKLADETADPYEKVDILKAIDYIKMPSYTEYLAYRRALKTGQVPTNLAALFGVNTNPPPAAAHP